ncbi:hypothetical protein [Melissospora conviva]|uniref:hypothetical protein n=1 Tax=Melissospora conviva TaxID=3388432 RepID=UPI003C1488CF
MPRKMKTYTLGNHGFINSYIRDALNLPSHICQAEILVVAATKADAAQVLDDQGFFGHNPRDPEFRVASGNDVDALDAAGLLGEPAVYVTTLIGRPGDWVVRVQSGGVPVRVGRLMAADGYGRVFEAVDQ